MTPTPFVARIAGESERMKTYRNSILSTVLWIFLTATCHAQTTWTIINLGVLPGGRASSANSINNSGQVVGRADSDAFLWSSGSGMQDLGTLGGTQSTARGINGSGQVVGNSLVPFPGGNHAFLWSSGLGMQDLGTLAGDMGVSDAYGINNSGQVVGWSSTVGGSVQRPFLWSSGSGMQNLGTLPGASDCVASGINDSSQVVGTCFFSSFRHAFLWSPGSGMQDLGILPGASDCQAFGISDNGQVVGFCLISNFPRPFLWSSGSGMQNLGPLPSGNDVLVSEPAGINNSGQVVGGVHAALWSSGSGTLDLNTLPAVSSAGWSLGTANAINNAGQIVGSGTINGQLHAYLLTPVNHVIKLSRPDGSSINDTILDEIEPGKTTTLIARVYDQNNQVVPNVDVQLEVKVKEHSGGHLHPNIDTRNRPEGYLSNGVTAGAIVSGNTGSAGLLFAFITPDPAGDHPITAKCTGGKTCTQQGPDTVWVGIKGLVTLSSVSATYELVGFTQSHPADSHRLTPKSSDNIGAAATIYRSRFPTAPILRLNDASLERGGLFDSSAHTGKPWQIPHETHRLGKEIDVRWNPIKWPDTGISDNNVVKFQKIILDLGGVAQRAYVGNPNNQHLHVILEH